MKQPKRKRKNPFQSLKGRLKYVDFGDLLKNLLKMMSLLQKVIRNYKRFVNIYQTNKSTYSERNL